MIIWFTGQPEHGKTTLAKCMKRYMPKAEIVDGDDLRDLFENKDYSEEGRRKNVQLAQNIAHFLHNKGKIALVALIAPYRDMREDFKRRLGNDILEVYVHTDQPKERDKYRVEGYEAPELDFLSLDTGEFSPELCIKKIIDEIEKRAMV